MAAESPLLRLPVELRLQIYDHCIVSGALTVAGCIVPPWWPIGIHATSETTPGVAPDRLPIARLGFDRHLLEGRLDLKSCTCVSTANTGIEAGACGADGRRPDKPPTLLQTPAWMLPARCSPSTQPPASLAPTIPSLHLTCRQIHHELSTHRNPYAPHGSKAHRKLDLYLSYPDGVCTVVHGYAHLLHQARTVHVAGICDIAGVANPEQEPHDVLRDGRKPKLNSHAPPSVEEAQADALLALVRNVHQVGKRAVDAAERATDPQSDDQDDDQNTTNDTTTSHHSPASSSTSLSSSSASSSAAVAPPPTTILTIDPPPPTANQTPAPTPTFYLRIFYPAYPLLRRTRPSPPATHPVPHDKLWLHNLSPVAVALATIHGGDIKFSLSRSSRGTGVEVIATGNRGRERVVHCLRPQHGFYGPSYEAQVWSWCIPHSWGVEDAGGGGAAGAAGVVEGLEERVQEAGPGGPAAAAVAVAAAVVADAGLVVEP